MIDRITIEQAVAFGRTYGFSSYPREECATGPILGFGEPFYSKLQQRGHLVGDYWLRDLDFCKLFREGICLVYNRDAQDDLWYDELPENITPLLGQTHLAEYISGPVPAVRLISKASLWKIMPRYLENAQIQDLPGQIPDEPCRLGVKPFVRMFLQNNPDFSGRTMACDFEHNGSICEIPGCYSELAWVKNGVVLIYMSGSAAGISRAWLLPNI